MEAVKQMITGVEEELAIMLAKRETVDAKLATVEEKLHRVAEALKAGRWQTYCEEGPVEMHTVLLASCV